MGKKRDVGGFHTPFAALADQLQAAQPPPAAKPAAPIAKVNPFRARELKGPRSASPLAQAGTDDALFLREIQGTMPLSAPKRARVSARPAELPKQPRRDDDAEVLATLADLCEGSGKFDLSNGDEYLEGVADGVDRRLLKRLRAGEYAVQAQLDLHGQTVEQARVAVARFVADARRIGHRCVLIVHGRGLHSQDELPVLKAALRGWLERGQLAKQVLAFATARPQHGGTGALYALVRR